MGNFDLLLYTPAIPLLLRTLVSCPEGRNEAALYARSPEKEYAARAVAELIEHGFVLRNNGRLILTGDGAKRKKIRHLLLFYEEVQRKAETRLTFRGILNATGYRFLVHLGTLLDMMGQEGFDRDDVKAVIAREETGGHVERVRIVYRTRDGFKQRYFPFIPFYYYPRFVVVNDGNAASFRAKLQDAGIDAVEEEYLLGDYPEEIANQAQDYITTRRRHIKERVKSEAFDISWYYRF